MKIATPFFQFIYNVKSISLRYHIVYQITLFYNKRVNTIIKIIPITSMTKPAIKNDFPVSFPLSFGVLLSVFSSTMVSVSEK